jgi:hypothetical protein
MRCSRIGCGVEAVATFCFDARATLVWVDTLDPGRGTGAGVLCAQHADALTPPRGWHLQDRRTGRPRLWEERPTAPVVDGGRPPAVDAEVEPGALSPDVGTLRRADVAADPLPFDDAPPAPADDLEDLFDPRSPLLARAFAGLRHR